jgi:hypothetical protein
MSAPATWRALVVRALDALADGEIDLAVAALWAALDAELPQVSTGAISDAGEPALRVCEGTVLA